MVECAECLDGFDRSDDLGAVPNPVACGGDVEKSSAFVQRDRAQVEDTYSLTRGGTVDQHTDSRSGCLLDDVNVSRLVD